MTQYAVPPLAPFRITLDRTAGLLAPEGPTLTRRMSDLEGLFAAESMRAASALADNPVVYSVVSSPVPETAR